jgi:hypothetical protein
MGKLTHKKKVSVWVLVVFSPFQSRRRERENKKNEWVAVRNPLLVFFFARKKKKLDSDVNPETFLTKVRKLEKKWDECNLTTVKRMNGKLQYIHNGQDQKKKKARELVEKNVREKSMLASFSMQKVIRLATIWPKLVVFDCPHSNLPLVLWQQGQRQHKKRHGSKWRLQSFRKAGLSNECVNGFKFKTGKVHVK